MKMISAFVLVTVLLLCIFQAACISLGQKNSPREDAKLLRASYYVIKESEEVQTLLRESGPAKEAEYLVLSRQHHPSMYALNVPMCAVHTSQTYSGCMGFPAESSPEDDPDWTLSKTLLALQDEITEAVEQSGPTHQQAMSRLHSFDDVPVVKDWMSRIERDTAFTVSFGPIYRPSRQYTDFFPCPSYVLGHVQNDINNIVGGEETFPFMIGFDSEGRSHVLYISPGDYHRLMTEITPRDSLSLRELARTCK